MKQLILLGFIFSLLFNGNLYSQEMRLSKGTVIDSLHINDSISESFSIYLPQDFVTDRPWPVILIFDAEGRGALATQLFRSIAEEQDYIIAASNENLTNDSLQANLPKASRFMNKVFASFPVDSNLVYAAGVGDGGALASAIPLIYNRLRGVLAVGEGWVNTQFVINSKPYLFSAVAGDEDYSMVRLNEIVAFFKKNNFPAEINYFEGKNDEWPNTFVLSNAVTGFTLQDMAQGFRKENPEFVNFLFNNELETIEMLRRQRKYYQAFEKLNQLENKYDLFDIDKDKIKNRKKELRRNKAFRQQRRLYRRAATWEAEKQEEYRYYLEMDVVSANFDNLGWWEFQIQELEEEEKKGNVAEQKAASRLQSFLEQLGEQQFKEVMQSEAKIDTKVYSSVLRTILDRDDPEAYLKIIALAGHDGDYETALLYLEDLLKTGFDDMEALYDIEGILDLKFSKEYNDKIREYLGEAKYYKAETFNETTNSGGR